MFALIGCIALVLGIYYLKQAVEESKRPYQSYNSPGMPREENKQENDQKTSCAESEQRKEQKILPTESKQDKKQKTHHKEDKQGTPTTQVVQKDPQQAKGPQSNEDFLPYIPSELIARLPDLKDIFITGCRTDDSDEHQHGRCGYWYYRGAFVEFCCQEEKVREVFANAFHPFMGERTEETRKSAGLLWRYIAKDARWFGISNELLYVGGIVMGVGARFHYEETEGQIEYSDSYIDSGHDGGGGGGTTWRVYKAFDKIPPKELQHGKIHDMPSCKGYWVEDQHCYLVDPWEMKGVFEFYHADWSSNYWDSDAEEKTIGVRRE